MADITSDSPVEGLGHFFDTIWQQEQGYVYLPTLDRSSNQWKKTMYEWPKHRHHVINHVLGKAAEGLDVYYAPAIFTEPKPDKEHLKGSNVVWTEYDGSAPKEWSPDTSVSPDGDGGPPVPPPTLRVQSSSDDKQHVYWQLDKFTSDIEWLENTNRSITYSTRADTSGWDATQVLRPPYTNNHKYADKPPVTITHVSKTKYSRERFSQLKPVKQLVSEGINTSDLPTVENVIATHKWASEDFKFFMDPTIEEGKRSAALMRLGYIGAEMGMTDTEIYAILDNADSRWGKYVGRADRKIRLLDILNRARTKHPNPVTDITFAGLAGTNLTVEQDIQYTYGFKDFLDSSVEVEWAIIDFLEKAGLGMVAAAPGVGKTQVSIQLAIACALGEPFLGWQPAKPMKMAVLSLEMSHVALKKFMETIAGQYTEDQIKLLQENLTVIPLGERMPLHKEATRTFLYTLLEQIQPEGLIIDSLVKLTDTKLDEDSVGQINHQLGVLRKKFGCFVWLIHHNRKANGDNAMPDSLDDVYGSVFIAAEMTAVLLLYRKRGQKQIAVINVKNRLHEERPMFMVERNEHLFFTEVAPALVFEGLTNVGGETDDSSNSAEDDSVGVGKAHLKL